jgi:hypothetical protein
MGSPMITEMEKKLRDTKLRIHRVNNGNKKCDKGYANMGAQVWGKGKALIEKCRVILPNDGKTMTQVTSREYMVVDSGAIQLVSKELMRRKGLDSPDRADALFLCLMDPTQQNPVKTYDDENNVDTQESKKYAMSSSGFDLGM